MATAPNPEISIIPGSPISMHAQPLPSPSLSSSSSQNNSNAPPPAWATAHISTWSVVVVKEWLQTSKPLSEYADTFLKEGVTGECLIELDMNAMRDDLGVEKYIHRKILKRSIEKFVAFGTPDTLSMSPRTQGREFQEIHREETENEDGQQQQQQQLEPGQAPPDDDGNLEDELRRLQRTLQLQRLENHKLRAHLAQYEGHLVQQQHQRTEHEDPSNPSAASEVLTAPPAQDAPLPPNALHPGHQHDPAVAAAAAAAMINPFDIDPNLMQSQSQPAAAASMGGMGGMEGMDINPQGHPALIQQQQQEYLAAQQQAAQLQQQQAHMMQQQQLAAAAAAGQPPHSYMQGMHMQQQQQMVQQQNGIGHGARLEDPADSDSSSDDGGMDDPQDGDDDSSVFGYEAQHDVASLETIEEEPWREECVRLQDLVESLNGKLTVASASVKEVKQQLASRVSIDITHEEVASDDEGASQSGSVSRGGSLSQSSSHSQSSSPKNTLRAKAMAAPRASWPAIHADVHSRLGVGSRFSSMRSLNPTTAADDANGEQSQEAIAVNAVKAIFAKYSSRLSASSSPRAANAMAPLLEAKLRKKSPSGLPGMRTWQRRWFKLFGDALCWYKDDLNNPLGILPVFAIADIRAPEHSTPDRLDIRINQERIVALRFSTVKERKLWQKKLQELSEAAVSKHLFRGRWWKSKKFGKLDHAEAEFLKQERRMNSNLGESLITADKPARSGHRFSSAGRSSTSHRSSKDSSSSSERARAATSPNLKVRVTEAGSGDSPNGSDSPKVSPMFSPSNKSSRGSIFKKSSSSQQQPDPTPPPPQPVSPYTSGSLKQLSLEHENKRKEAAAAAAAARQPGRHDVPGTAAHAFQKLQKQRAQLGSSGTILVTK